MFTEIVEILPTTFILGYVFGAVGLFLSYFRPGINPNIPVARFEGRKEFIMILLISIFWPIYVIISILYEGYKLISNHNDA